MTTKKTPKRPAAATAPPMSSTNPIVIDDVEPCPKRHKPSQPKPSAQAKAVSRPTIIHPLDNGPEFTGPLLFIIVGENGNKREFAILEKTICQSSEHMNAEVERYKTTPEAICLELVGNPDIFHIYLKWLYSGRLFMSNPISTPTQEPVLDLANPFNRQDGVWARWKACYELGNILMDADFKDTLMDAAVEKLKGEDKNTVHDIARYMPEVIYPSSAEGSHARAFTVDLFLRKCKQGDIESVRKENKYPEFIGDLLVATGKQFLDNALKLDPLVLSFSDQCLYYHDHHKVGRPCYRTRKTYWF